MADLDALKAEAMGLARGLTDKAALGTLTLREGHTDIGHIGEIVAEAFSAGRREALAQRETALAISLRSILDGEAIAYTP